MQKILRRNPSILKLLLLACVATIIHSSLIVAAASNDHWHDGIAASAAFEVDNNRTSKAPPLSPTELNTYKAKAKANRQSRVVLTPKEKQREGSQGKTTSYHNVEWSAVFTTYAPLSPMNIDVECTDGTIAVANVDNTLCSRLSTSWLRCAALTNGDANVLVSCTGDLTNAAHQIMVRTVPLSWPGGASADIIGLSMVLTRRCRSGDLAYNPELYSNMLCTGQFEDEDECLDVNAPFCDFTFGFCVPIPPSQTTAIVGNAAEERCLYDAAEEGLVHDTPSIAEQIAPLADEVVPALPLDDDDEVELSTFRLYFGSRVDDEATGCDVTPQEAFLVCSNGQTPEIIDGSGWVYRGVLIRGVIYRYFSSKFSSGDVRLDLSCRGTPEDEVQLLAFQRSTTLRQCSQPDFAKQIIWSAEFCGGTNVGDPDGDDFNCLLGEQFYLVEAAQGSCQAFCLEGSSCSGFPSNFAAQEASSCKVKTCESGCSLPTSPPEGAPASPTASPTLRSVETTASPTIMPNSSPVEAPTAPAPTAPTTTSSPLSAPTAQPTEPSSSGSCFSGQATVQVEHQVDPVPMMALQIGDRVLTSHQQVYEPIYAFGHWHDTQTADFLQITTKQTSGSNNAALSHAAPLEISGEHMLFVRGKQGAVRADTVHVGDVVYHVSSETPSFSFTGNQKPTKDAPVVITRINTVRRQGVYAPLTASGSLVVDGIQVSTYAGVLSDTSEYIELKPSSQNVKTVFLPLLQESLIHASLSPLRLVCKYVSSKLCEQHDAKTGVLQYVAHGMRLLQWGEAQPVVVQVYLLGVALATTRLSLVLENVFASSYGIILAAIAFLMWMALKSSQKDGFAVTTSKQKRMHVKSL